MKDHYSAFVGKLYGKIILKADLELPATIAINCGQELIFEVSESATAIIMTPFHGFNVVSCRHIRNFHSCNNIDAGGIGRRGGSGQIHFGQNILPSL